MRYTIQHEPLEILAQFYVDAESPEEAVKVALATSTLSNPLRPPISVVLNLAKVWIVQSTDPITLAKCEVEEAGHRFAEALRFRLTNAGSEEKLAIRDLAASMVHSSPDRMRNWLVLGGSRIELVAQPTEDEAKEQRHEAEWFVTTLLYSQQMPAEASPPDQIPNGPKRFDRM